MSTPRFDASDAVAIGQEMLGRFAEFSAVEP